MRKFSIFCILICIGLTSLYFPIQVKANRYFDSYGIIPWAEEKAHLYALAVELKHDPNLIGYVGYYIGEKDKADNFRARIKRAKKYLIYELNIPERRIVTIELGRREETYTILQPGPKDKPPPFSKEER